MTDFPPDQVPLAELIGCPTRRYQPAWRILPLPPEPRPPERTEALHPNGCWYDTETGHRIWRLDCGRPAPYGRERRDAGAETGEPPLDSPWETPHGDVLEGFAPRCQTASPQLIARDLFNSLGVVRFRDGFWPFVQRQDSGLWIR